MASKRAGIAADQHVVLAAFSETWSNGQTEGQITKLNRVRRQMHRSAKLDLLHARMMGVRASTRIKTDSEPKIDPIRSIGQPVTFQVQMNSSGGVTTGAGLRPRESSERE